MICLYVDTLLYFDIININKIRKEDIITGTLLVISIISASVYSCILNKTKVRSKKDVFGFNLLCSIVWLAILFTINGAYVSITRQTLVWGIVYGVIQALFIFFKTEAMSTGPVSITTLVGNSSLLVSIFVSYIAWNESVGVWDMVGLALLCFSIFLCTHKKSQSDYMPQWKYFVVLFLIFAAAVGIVFKAFGKSQAADLCNDMMIISAFTMIVFYLAFGIACGGFNFRTAERGSVNGSVKNFVAAALASGALSCLYCRLNMFLTGKLDAIVFFPFFNGGVVLLSTLLGMFVCREMLSRKQFAGIFLGVASICIIGIL